MSALSHVRATVSVAGLVALVAASGCGRRDDGSIAADPDTKLHAGFPVVFAAPPPSPAPGAPSPSNPLAMDALKHDAPAPPAGAAAAKSAAHDGAVADPCAVKDPKGPLAMRLRHDGASDGPRRSPLCMRLK